MKEAISSFTGDEIVDDDEDDGEVSAQVVGGYGTYISNLVLYFYRKLFAFLGFFSSEPILVET